ncbi:MAG: serine hydrolase domain-containing protein [Acidobacteriota bacterium]
MSSRFPIPSPCLLVLTAALAAVLACGPPLELAEIPDVSPDQEALQLSIGLLRPVRLAGEERERMHLEARMQHHGVPGLVVAVIDGGELRWIRAYGETEAGGDVDVEPKTLFQAGSVSKMVTSMAILRRAERGDLDLEAPLDAALSGWTLPGPGADGVTVAQLLAHTAGVGVPSYSGYPADVETLPDLGAILGGVPPAQSLAVTVTLAPGERWRYSGGGYMVLQRLLEELAGAPFETVMREDIFGPLGMHSSTFRHPLPADLASRAAVGHDATGAPLSGAWRHYPESAAAGLWTTAEDLLTWIVDVQKAYAGKPGRRLGKATARSMVRAQEPGGWGLGPELGGRGHARWFGHRGGNAGYRSLAIGFVHSGQGMVVLTNSDRGMDLAHEIAAGLAEVYGWPTFAQVERTAVDVAPEVWSGLVGTYALDAFPEMTLTVGMDDGDGLPWAELFGRRSRLYAAPDGTFFDLDAGWVLEVSAPGAGGGGVSAVELQTWEGIRWSARR